MREITTCCAPLERSLDRHGLVGAAGPELTVARPSVRHCRDLCTPIVLAEVVALYRGHGDGQTGKRVERKLLIQRLRWVRRKKIL